VREHDDVAERKEREAAVPLPVPLTVIVAREDGHVGELLGDQAGVPAGEFGISITM
jgi:hypothetical protein